MQGVNLQFQLLSSGRPPSLAIPNSSPSLLLARRRSLRTSAYLRCGCLSRLRSLHHKIRAQASNANIGAGSFEGGGGTESHGDLVGGSSETSPEKVKPPSGAGYLLSIAGVLFICAVAFSLIVFFKGRPSAVVGALAKSGFTAAFTLIFVSEIGDKTFFIAALLAMQYKRALVLLGSMGALSLMTILSVIIGRIFHSVPAQFQTTLPIGEYAAVALLTFFGLKSIKDAWGLPSAVSNKNKETSELGELVEAEELVKEKDQLACTIYIEAVSQYIEYKEVATKLTNPLEILWKSFSLVFFAEWGDRSMLATIALGAAQSPWGVAGGAIGGHLLATSIAVLGGAFLANYISEKLVGFLGGVLFLIFAAATLLGVF